MINHPIFWYVTGLVSAIIAYIFFRRFQVFLAYSRNRHHEQSLASQPTSPLQQQARTYIELCQKRLLLQARLNPDWLEPLKAELPLLVRDIATTFYPDSANPLLNRFVPAKTNATTNTSSAYPL